METICSIELRPAARALVTVIDQGERADFFARAMDAEFDMPWALTAAVEIAAANGIGLIDAFGDMAYGGIYEPDFPVKEKVFEQLEEDSTIRMLQGFHNRNGWLGKRIGFDFDTGEMSVEHDQALFTDPMPDGSWQMDAKIYEKLGRPLPAVEAGPAAGQTLTP